MIIILQVIEFGAGDGGPVLASLSGSGFQGVVHGFEINERAASIARNRALEFGLQKSYQVLLILGVYMQLLYTYLSGELSFLHAAWCVACNKCQLVWSPAVC